MSASPASPRHSGLQKTPGKLVRQGHARLDAVSAALPRRHYFRSAHVVLMSIIGNVLPLATGVMRTHSRQSSSI